MAIEDVALACALPGFTVIVPADGAERSGGDQHAMIEREGPTFLRCGRPKVPIIYPDGADFHDRKGEHVARRRRRHHRRQRDHGGDGPRCGRRRSTRKASTPASSTCTRSSRSMSTAIETAANETKAIVVAEEHLAYGGLGSTVAMVARRTEADQDGVRRCRGHLRDVGQAGRVARASTG